MLTGAAESAESAESTVAAETSGEPSERASEQIVQDVVKVSEPATEVRSRIVSKAGMTELVVLLSLFRIAEHSIRLGCLLELLFGFLVARIFVRMIFYCQRSVRLLYLVGRRRFRYAEHVIIISLFCHNCRFSYFLAN